MHYFELLKLFPEVFFLFLLVDLFVFLKLLHLPHFQQIFFAIACPISDKMSQNFCGYDFNTIVSGSESCISEYEIYPQIKINQKKSSQDDPIK